MSPRQFAGFTLLGFLAGAGSCSCNQRFAFDIPQGGAAGQGGLAAAGDVATAGAGAVAGNGGSPPGGAAGGLAGGSSGEAPGCGDGPACPEQLRCVSGSCFQCEVDADCTSAETPKCDPERSRCVACLTTSDCADGRVCDQRANHCLPPCAGEADCPEDAHGCDEERGVCYDCDEDRECEDSPLGPLCAIDGSGCVQCREEGDCPGEHCDPLSGRCVECRDGADCPSKVCDPSSGACYAG